MTFREFCRRNDCDKWEVQRLRWYLVAMRMERLFQVLRA